jgi:hypothetical protein
MVPNPARTAVLQTAICLGGSFLDTLRAANPHDRLRAAIIGKTIATGLTVVDVWPRLKTEGTAIHHCPLATARAQFPTPVIAIARIALRAANQKRPGHRSRWPMPLMLMVGAK